MLSNHLILCCPLLFLPSIFPSIRFFSRLFTSGDQSNGASALVSVLPVKIQGCFSLELIGLISLLSKGLSRAFSRIQFESINSLVLSLLSVQLSHPYKTNGKTVALTIWASVGKMISLLFNTLSRFVLAFLQKSKRLLVSRLQSPSTVILEPKRIKSVTASTFALLFTRWDRMP